MAERNEEDNNKSNAVLKAKCDALLKSIADVQEIIKEQGELAVASMYAVIAGPLCKLTKTIEPNAGKKIDEIIYAYEHKNQNITVNDKQHGADFIEQNGGHTELKASTCKKKKNGVRANFCWPLPKGKTEEERRTKLLDSVKEKTEGGMWIAVATDGVQRTLQEYKISHEFLMAYFTRVKFKNCNVHNMGCTQCKTCKHFHRLLKMQQYSDMMQKDKLKDLTEEQWTHVFEKTKSDCNGNKVALVNNQENKKPI